MSNLIEVRVRTSYQSQDESVHYSVVDIDDLKELERSFRKYKFTDVDGMEFVVDGGSFVQGDDSVYFELLLEIAD